MDTKLFSIYNDLLAFANQIEIIDAHEHLPEESKRVKMLVDFSTLFSHYCIGDMIAAGMNNDDLKVIQDPNQSIEIKWKIFSPYYNLIKNGSYCRSARIAMNRFYGKFDLTDLNDAIDITEQIRQSNKPGIYKKILEDACRIKTAFLFTNDNFQSNFFKFVDTIDHLCYLRNLDDLLKASDEIGGNHYTLTNYVDSLGLYLKQKVDRKVKGIKFTCAYYRNLDFQQVPTAEADRIFNKLSAPSGLISDRLTKAISNEDVIILQDYLIRRVLEHCEQLGLVVVFHTGLQAGNRNNPQNAHPGPLWHLFYNYSKLNFVILHCGLPWLDETAMLAKSYPNVFMDMAWVHIISPELSVRALNTWIDMIPKNKIFGFGGDYMVVEKIYGHLCMAKENICWALSEKVANGIMSESEACSWIEHLFYINAKNIYLG